MFYTVNEEQNSAESMCGSVSKAFMAMKAYGIWNLEQIFQDFIPEQRMELHKKM